MTTVAGHILLPHNGWATGQPVRWSRTWQTGVAAAISGREQRGALRAQPRHKLTCDLLAESLQERCRLDARVDAAIKSGLAGIPFFGRGAALLANAAEDATEIILFSTDAWPWQAGDYAILMADDITFDVLPVVAVAGTTLDFGLETLDFPWPSGSIVRPLLFGKFSADKENALTDWHGGWTVTIEQLVAERTTQLGTTPAHVPGVGEAAVGTTLTVG